ncbi:MAG: hypothetical protein AEth_01284 [Candidatus Argoarchaeum ethanivorans]|uniref:Uncharacterized protein n=1 Tax=Candidatus Argoarchaeum ethanivorans TaxID=2608793 RepID=A0A8B3S238_9EURY|nr:MAG: hypothetical protein AEth_01284 [Candidatus Argoarchaeum ethanivorans]
MHWNGTLQFPVYEAIRWGEINKRSDEICEKMVKRPDNSLKWDVTIESRILVGYLLWGSYICIWLPLLNYWWYFKNVSY